MGAGCYTGKEEQYPERLLAYNCSKCPVLTGKINAACIIFLILTLQIFKKQADTQTCVVHLGATAGSLSACLSRFLTCLILGV